MDAVSVTIQGFFDDSFPGFVACLLVDADGNERHFVDKAPVLGPPDLSFDSVFPQPGHIACAVRDEWIDGRGRKLVRVCTSQPWGLESTAGETYFTVLRDQIVDR